jgi:glycosyltransferase involved in cell wall biosynthesis
VSSGSPSGSAASESLVSVITPVHNGERYLPECIESVLAQSHGNWELIIADNASTDRTLEVAHSYADADSRMRVVAYDEFVDVIRSFNRAFRLMSPEARYCKPLAGDDLLFPECLERMVALAARHPEVGLVSGYRLDGRSLDFRGIPATIEILPGRDVCRATLLGGVWAFGASSTTMIRADLVRAPLAFYNERNIHADLESCYEVLQQTSFGFVHELLTYTRRHPDAVSQHALAIMTHQAENIRILERYGPGCLSRDEYHRRHAVLLFEYLRELAKNLGRFRDERVRAYHADTLRAIRSSLTARSLGHGVALQLERMLVGPRTNGADWLIRRYGGASLVAGAEEATDAVRS